LAVIDYITEGRAGARDVGAASSRLRPRLRCCNLGCRLSLDVGNVALGPFAAARAHQPVPARLACADVVVDAADRSRQLLRRVALRLHNSLRVLETRCHALVFLGCRLVEPVSIVRVGIVCNLRSWNFRTAKTPSFISTCPCAFARLNRHRICNLGVVSSGCRLKGILDSIQGRVSEHLR